MAFDEHLIDQVNRLPAMAGRTAWPERRSELRTWCLLPPHPPAGETPGLARQILECQLEGLEPAAEAFGIDEAIGFEAEFDLARAIEAAQKQPSADQEHQRQRHLNDDQRATEMVVRGRATGGAGSACCMYR